MSTRVSLTLKSTGHNTSEHTNTEEPAQEAFSTGRTVVWGSEVRESDPTLTSHRASRFMETGLWLPSPSASDASPPAKWHQPKSEAVLPAQSIQ